MTDYSILINTCDKFEDCWQPFFLLFKKYWPDCNGKLFLNTEYKDFSYAGLDITAIKGCAAKGFPKSQRATWSQCFKWALEALPTDIVLYMQEDYFLKSTVSNQLVEQYVALMQQHKDIRCIHLTDQAVQTEADSGYENLKTVQIVQRDRVSCQAALWQKDELLSLIKEQESAWEFEEFGSKRSSAMARKYLAVSRDFVKLDIYEIIPYIFTGIVQGRWYRPVVKLFKDNGIEMDYSRRGFSDEVSNHRPLSKRIYNRIKRMPKAISCWWECRKLRKN